MTRGSLRVTVMSTLLLWIGMAGCGLFPTPFVEQTFPAADLDDAWRETLKVVDKEFDVVKTSKGSSSRSFETSWAVRLGTFRYQGQRRRVLGDVKESGGAVTVALKVQVNTNTDIDQPGKISNAKWREEADDTMAAQRLLRLIDIGIRERQRRAEMRVKG